MVTEEIGVVMGAVVVGAVTEEIDPADRGVDTAVVAL